MDKDRIKGKVEEAGGRVERQAGEWTGDKKKEVEGLKHEIKGKIRNAAGQVKDAARDAMKDRGKDQPESELDEDDRDEGAA